MLFRYVIKGQCYEIFDFRFFFINQFPPSPLSITLGLFRIFRIFAEIFEAQGEPVANGKNLQPEKCQ
jgi:hypothetical protein